MSLEIWFYGARQKTLNEIIRRLLVQLKREEKERLVLKTKVVMMAFVSTLILSMFVAVPLVRGSPAYGPHLDEIYGRFIESPSAQRSALETGVVNFWFDMREPEIVRELSDAGFTVVMQPEVFLFYYIAPNLRWGRVYPIDDPRYDPDGFKWRPDYVPLNDQPFRHALAHLVPKAKIESVAYGGLTGAAIESIVPPAQREWFNSEAPTHPLSHEEAISILTAAGYEYDAELPNPVAGVVGNWRMPDRDPVPPEYRGEPMPKINYWGVTTAIGPRSWLRDELCALEFQAIGLPIEHVEVDYSTLVYSMIYFHDFDMYSLGWGMGKNPDFLVDFFHSDMDVQFGYNTAGIQDEDLDNLIETIQTSIDRDEVRDAAMEAQVMLNEKLPYIVTVTRPDIGTFATAGAPGQTDTLLGVINSPGYGQFRNDWTFYNLRWASGLGGTASMVVASEPETYNPALSSTTDEELVLGRCFDVLIEVDPYTHKDIPWLALDWTVETWGAEGMNITISLRDDVYWHDGVKFTAYDVEFALDYLQTNEVARAQPLWLYFVDAEVKSDYVISAYFSQTSLWTLNWMSDWTARFPKHIYEGTDPNTFFPHLEAHPTISGLTKLIGTGPFVYRGGSLVLGGYCRLTAYRPGASPVTTHWWMSTEGTSALLADMFHRAGDVDSDGDIDIWDKVAVHAAAGSKAVDDPFTPWDETENWNPDADLDQDEDVDILDIVTLNLNFGKKKEYP